MSYLSLIKFILIFCIPLTSLFSHGETSSHNKFYISTIYTKSINVKHENFSALANYLEKNNTKNLKFDIKLVKSSDEAIKLINSSLIDIFIDSIYPTKIIHEKTNLRAVCKNWNHDSESYRSVIFVKKSSTINKLSDLKNKTIAFEDRFSTSAYFIPKRAIEKSGIAVDNTSNKQSVHYTFANSEENCAAKVLFNQVDAAAIDEKNFDDLNKGFFKVIYKSDIYPRKIVSFSDKISNEVEDEILRVLYNMDKTEDGKKLLKKLSKFSPLQLAEKKLIKEGIKWYLITL